MTTMHRPSQVVMFGQVGPQPKHTMRIIYLNRS
jgi:hypothetical protein